ncbi:MAG: hypothetical protein GX754_11850 [Clostridiaceae bacterium]|nr:hypothetical protein [Clostridiaceae bacterium]
MFVILEGDCLVKFDEECYYCNPGCFCYINPGVFHSVTLINKKNLLRSYGYL